MMRLAIAILLAFSIQSCSSGIWDAAFTGACIASEASCIKSCQGDYQSGYASALGYDSCAASCTGGGNGCAFTSN